MGGYRIRPADAADAVALARVHVRSWQTSYRGIVPDEFLDTLDQQLPVREERWRQLFGRADRELVHVAEAEGAGVVGFARGGPARAPHFGLDGELGALYLLREHQRHGLGRALVAAHAKALVAAGYRSMFVWVLTANPARSFYERLGGTRLGTATDRVAGERLEETAYGWRDLPALLHELDAPASRKPFY